MMIDRHQWFGHPSRPALALRMLAGGAAALLPMAAWAQAQESLPQPAPSSVTPPATATTGQADPFAAGQGPVPSAIESSPVRAGRSIGPSSPLPGFPGTGPAPGVVDNPNRIFGDDALDPVGLDLLGTVIGGFGLTASAAVNATYISNFARIGDDETLPEQFESKSDWRFTPSISAEIARPLGKQRIFVSGSAGYDFLVRNSNFNRSRLGINGGLQWQLGSRCSGLFSGGWNQRATRQSDFATLVAGNQQSTNLGATGGCALPSGIGFNVGVQASSLRNEAEQRQFADVDSTSANATLFYNISARGNISLNGFLASSTFPNQLLPDGSENGIDISGLSLGAAYSFGPNLRVNGQIGRSWVRPDNPFNDDFSGTTWSIGLGYSGPRLGGNLSVARNFSANRGGFVGAQQVTSYQASITYRANDRLRASTGVSRSEQDFRIVSDDIGAQGRSSVRDDRVFAGVDFNLSRLITLSADINHIKRTSNPAEFGFSDTRAGLTLRASI